MSTVYIIDIAITDIAMLNQLHAHPDIVHGKRKMVSVGSTQAVGSNRL
jgi:hypothetical protein